jgi:hypothetical protein
MKKTINILTYWIIVILILSGCSSTSKVNEKLKGEGEDWTVYYKIKGQVDTEFDENDVNKYITDGNYLLQSEYKGEFKDLQTINEFAVSGPGINGFYEIASERENEDFSNFSDSSLYSYPVINKGGTPSVLMLEYFYDNDETSITIEWHGEINGVLIPKLFDASFFKLNYVKNCLK